MTFNDNNAFDLVVARLNKLNRLSPACTAAIAALPFVREVVPADAHIVREGQMATHCCFLIDGFACRYKVAHDGGRQIASFNMAGDILDLQHLLLSVADHSVQTITTATYLRVPSAALRLLTQEHSDLAEALWRDTLIDASIFREWVLNVGRRDAKTRIAHMLCEFAVRYQAAGFGTPERFTLPMTQEHIADATGLTPVHVNRTLRVLSEAGLIARDGRKIVIADWKRMQQAADFDPLYLHGAVAAA